MLAGLPWEHINDKASLKGVLPSISRRVNYKMFALLSPNLATNQLERLLVVLGCIEGVSGGATSVPPVLGPSARGHLFLGPHGQKERL